MLNLTQALISLRYSPLHISAVNGPLEMAHLSHLSPVSCYTIHPNRIASQQGYLQHRYEVYVTPQLPIFLFAYLPKVQNDWILG